MISDPTADLKAKMNGTPNGTAARAAGKLATTPPAPPWYKTGIGMTAIAGGALVAAIALGSLSTFGGRSSVRNPIGVTRRSRRRAGRYVMQQVETWAPRAQAAYAVYRRARKTLKKR